MESSEKMVQVNDQLVADHLGEVVRTTVEQMLNTMLDQEADRICNAQRYEHSPERTDTRAGHYERTMLTRAGEVNLKVPKLRKLPFETAIIERYKRREVSVEEALIEMYLAGISVRRIEDVTEALWGARVSAGTISELNQKAYANIEEWRNRPIAEVYPYVFVDGIWLKRSWGGEIRNVSVLVATGVSKAGYREILGVAEGMKEDAESWLNFFRHLKSRGLKDVRLIVSDKCLGVVEAAAICFPEARWQRCVVHFYRNVFSSVPRTKMREVANMLKAIHAQEDLSSAQAKAQQVVTKLREMRLADAAECVREGIDETLVYLVFPPEHWVRIRTTNALERIMREIRRRTRVVGNFPDGRSALMLVAARLRYVLGTVWGSRLYLNMECLKEIELMEDKVTA